MKKTKLYLLGIIISLLSVSCDLLKPISGSSPSFEKRKRKNNTVIIRSNVNHFQISYENMTCRKFQKIKGVDMTTDNGVYEYFIPVLVRPYIKFRVESPGYISKEVIVKRTIGFDIVKIPKSGKEIRVDLNPIQ